MAINITEKGFKKFTWWLNEIPCIHRIHDQDSLVGAHRIQKKLGMSISLLELDNKMRKLSNLVSELNESGSLNQRILLTFDDGHKDILKVVSLIKSYPKIQPILFITGKLLRGDTQPLPLTALYSWCELNNENPNELHEKFDFDRKSLKLMPEDKQRDMLKSVGITVNPEGEEMLTRYELDTLIKNNWLIGYHGSHHCDLRIQKASELENPFTADFKLLSELGLTPWIAWPEGRWNDSLYSMAQSVGFDVQFGLRGEKGIGESTEVIDRVIWK
jgi:hypothetical protein